MTLSKAEYTAAVGNLELFAACSCEVNICSLWLSLNSRANSINGFLMKRITGDFRSAGLASISVYRFIGSLWSGFPYIRYIPEKQCDIADNTAVAAIDLSVEVVTDTEFTISRNISGRFIIG